MQEHLKESDFGAKSLAMESYKRGSVDNITVLIIAFKNDVYKIASASSSAAAAAPPAPAAKSPSVSAAAAVQRSNSIKTK